jgi:cytidine deaminase
VPYVIPISVTFVLAEKDFLRHYASMSKDIQTAYKLAIDARKKAHAPYSDFLVGATFKVKGKDLFYSGCNVENASFGGTVCAERVGIWKWVSERDADDTLEFLVLVTDTPNPVATPCGMCLQVLSEFCPPDFPIHLANTQAIEKQVVLKDLFPMTFSLKK